MFSNFCPKIGPFKKCRNVEKYDRVRKATDDYTIGCMPVAWQITKATNTHSEYVTLIAIPRQPCLHERHQCHFIRTLPVLIMLSPHLWPPSYLCTKLPMRKRQPNSGTHTTRMRNTKGRQRTPNNRSS